MIGEDQFNGYHEEIPPETEEQEKERIAEENKKKALALFEKDKEIAEANPLLKPEENQTKLLQSIDRKMDILIKLLQDMKRH